MRKRKSDSNKYSLDDLASLHRQGQVSDREFRRAGGIALDEDDDESGTRRATGFDPHQEYGPSDLGHIDAKGNRRSDKESRLRGRADDNSRLWPSDAHVRRVSAHQFHPSWYSGGPGRER
jgi:hypothetical protein